MMEIQLNQSKTLQTGGATTTLIYEKLEIPISIDSPIKIDKQAQTPFVEF